MKLNTAADIIAKKKVFFFPIRSETGLARMTPRMLAACPSRK